jgi:serine protease Do
MQMAIQVAEQLVTFGKLRRGYLGVTLDPDFTIGDQPGDSEGYSGGAMVKSVRRGSPAELARLQRGDVIVEFNGNAVDNDDHLVTQVGLTAIGESVPMVILRDGTRYRTEVVLTDLN